jgi:hypothetical protein
VWANSREVLIGMWLFAVQLLRPCRPVTRFLKRKLQSVALSCVTGYVERLTKRLVSCDSWGRTHISQRKNLTGSNAMCASGSLSPHVFQGNLSQNR